MKITITLTFFICLLIACSGGENSSNGSSESKPVAAAKKPDGAKIYKSYCITCHGAYGDMGASGAFNLTTSTLSQKERVEVITNGRKLMTPFKDLLSEEKIEAVAEYIETLRK